MPLRTLAVMAFLAVAAPLNAQLRPLPMADWHAIGHAAACGAAYYSDIGVGLLGSKGRLRSVGDCTAGLDLGGARLQVSGVAWRTFEETSSYADPFDQVDTTAGAVRSDWGDLLIETLVPVRFASGWMTGLRVGARVPITDNRIGIERDRMDMHVIAMGGYEADRWAGSVEAGVAINGTRVTWREQQDVLAYAARLEYRPWRRVRLHVGARGHFNDRTERGNENQGEVRAGVRLGDGLWVDGELVAGYTEASPAWGLRLRVGRRWGPGGSAR